jgi:hypothetical protein
MGPSLDRIIPNLGYVPGNLRIVSNFVNIAMNEWGEEALKAFVEAYAAHMAGVVWGTPA